MKTFIIAVALLAASPSLFARDTYVRGYTRSNGTYVAPYHRTSPDNSRINNYSTQGNYNPYSGNEGTKPLYPSYNSPSRNDNDNYDRDDD